jgi:hypothetical protein
MATKKTKKAAKTAKAPKKAARTISKKPAKKATKAAPKKAKAAPKKAPAKKATTPSAPTNDAMTLQRVDALAKVFAALGARNPERWARLHVDTGSDELGRFVLLRALWMRIVEPGRLLANAHSDENAGPAVGRLLKGASLADLDAIVRYAQRTALEDICEVLDDPAVNEDGIRWAVFRVDNTGMPLWTLDGLRSGLRDSEP